ncbi:MAG: GAF domain-containing protein, partial [Chloroflexi bacterium]|nr:GAF domain-containing protein [Chloroflexota bacterium]
MTVDATRSYLDLLYNISRELASALELRTVLQRVLFQSLKYVGGERGSIVVLDENGNALDSAIVYGMQVHDHTTHQLRDTIDRGLAGWVVRQRKAAWVPDTSRDERWLRRPDDAADRSGAKSAMCVPLLTRERLVGVLTIFHPVPNTYTREHFDLIQAIADQAGIAVLNARLYAESQRQARVMTALAASAEAINATLELDAVLQRILNETIQALQVETVALALLDSNWDLVFQAATGEKKDAVVTKRILAGQGVAGWVVHEGEGVVIPVAAEDKRFIPAEQFDGMDIHALAIAPIHAQGRVIGVLEAINPVSGAFDPDALLALAGIGNLAGSTIQHAQLFERLQAAHKRYRELFDDSIDPILLTDRNGKILEANRQASILSGFNAKELTGMKIGDLHQVGMDAAGWESITTGKVVSYESTLKGKGRRTVPIQAYVRRVVFEEVESLQWTLRDITERKDLDSLREDLIAMIYHDLRSPLANIVSSLDVLSSLFGREENETVQSVLTIASCSTARIQRLISSLLDINRLESGQPVGSQEAVTVKSLFDDALDAVQPMAESRSQAIKVVIPGKLPAAWVDVDMIRRVLINLLENASKFSPPEGKIELGAALDDNWLKVWVQDTGPGIPAAEQGRIFEKFTRLKVKGGPGGLGVGLAFCRLAVLGHGGRIWVESKAGHGARFLLTLPPAREN